MKTFLQQMPAALFCDLPARGRPNTTAARCSGLAIVLILTVVGFVVGAKVYLLHQRTAEFYQSRFDVAVSIACTGHVNAVARDAEVDAFLNDHSAALKSCAGVDAARSDSWNDFHASSLYLYALTALSWKLFGFNWSSLAALAGLFTAASAVGAYLFVRCFTSSRVVAFALSLAVLFAGPALEQIPNLRDFSKAPLIFLGLGLIGRAVFSAASFRRALLLAGCVGVIIGLGKGLRPDAIVLAPIALASFVLLSRAEGWRVRTKQVLSMLLALAIGYAVAGAPAEIVNRTKVDTVDTNPHALILGFAELFQDTLGFERGNYALVQSTSTTKLRRSSTCITRASAPHPSFTRSIQPTAQRVPHC